MLRKISDAQIHKHSITMISIVMTTMWVRLRKPKQESVSMLLMFDFQKIVNVRNVLTIYENVLAWSNLISVFTHFIMQRNLVYAIFWKQGSKYVGNEMFLEFIIE